MILHFSLFGGLRRQTCASRLVFIPRTSPCSFISSPMAGRFWLSVPRLWNRRFIYYNICPWDSNIVSKKRICGYLTGRTSRKSDLFVCRCSALDISILDNYKNPGLCDHGKSTLWSRYWGIYVLCISQVIIPSNAKFPPLCASPARISH